MLKPSRACNVSDETVRSSYRVQNPGGMKGGQLLYTLRVQKLPQKFHLVGAQNPVVNQHRRTP